MTVDCNTQKSICDFYSIENLPSLHMFENGMMLQAFKKPFERERILHYIIEVNIFEVLYWISLIIL